MVQRGQVNLVLCALWVGFAIVKAQWISARSAAGTQHWVWLQV